MLVRIYFQRFFDILDDRRYMNFHRTKHNFNLRKKEKRKELIEIELKLKPSRYQFPIDSN